MLRNKNIVVTGATGALGKELLTVLLSLDANVFAVYHRNLPNTAGIEWVEGSLDSRSEVNDLVHKLRLKVDKLHGIVNAAAVISYAETFELDDDSWDRQLFVNVKAPIYLSCGLLPELMAGKQSSVVNVGSITVNSGAVSVGCDYVASKGALMAASITLGKKWLTKGVRVTGILPGPFASAALTKSPQGEYLTELARSQELPTARDIANVIAFLLSDASRAITATTLNVSGGFSVG